MKICTNCNENKPFSEFYRDKRVEDGFRSRCKECYSAISKKYHQENAERMRSVWKKYRDENPDKVRAAHKKYREKNSDKVRAAVEKCEEKNRKINQAYIAKEKGISCMDCGATESKGKRKALDLHHRDPSTKEFDVSRYIGCPWETIKDEIEKCDLLCAQCHKKRHNNI